MQRRLSIILVLALVVELTTSFAPRDFADVVGQCRIRSTQRFSILDDLNQQDQNIPDKFNPFDYKSTKSNSAYSYSGTQISLRKTQMQELTSEMLNCVTDQEATQRLLQDYKNFLLEPLNDLEAVLDPDSIYTPQMTRSQRYQAYRASMEDRLQKANNPKVKAVLTSLRDFVVSHES